MTKYSGDLLTVFSQNALFNYLEASIVKKDKQNLQLLKSSSYETKTIKID